MPDKRVLHFEGRLQPRAALFYFPRAVTVPAPAADVGLYFARCHSPCALRGNQVLKNRVKSVGVVSTSCVWSPARVASAADRCWSLADFSSS